MVILEGMLAHRNFADRMNEDYKKSTNDIVLGFGKGASIVLAVYFTLKVFGVASGNNWHLLGTNYGLWFLVEILGFVLLPCFLFTIGVRGQNKKLIRWTALLTVLGIIINRLNIVWICFNWQLSMEERYFPHWMEIVLSVFVITLGLVIYRFIVTRMPVFYENSEYREIH